MAIKSWDPRKLQDRDIQGNRFEELVTEGWEDAHEADSVSSTERSNTPRDTSNRSRHRRGWAATHNPFTDLRDQLTRR